MDAADEAQIELGAAQLSALLTRHLPGVLSSVNLVGSTTDGDFHARHSDLDFVAVLSRSAGPDEIEGLTIIHRLYATDPTLPTLDGIWITEADLAAGPDETAEGPTTESGVFLASARGNRNPVTWFTLHDRSRTILGELDRAGIWRDPERLASWTRENVESYWVPWLAESKRPLRRHGLALLGAEGVMWGVLGISRLHATITTGAILSKSGAGEHALNAFEPRWHRIINEALRIRRGEGGGSCANPLERRKDALAFVAMVIASIGVGG